MKTPILSNITATKFSKASLTFWFSLSLTFAAIYSLLALQQAFEGEYVVQDDARQHIFWMRRFLDPSLFPNDLIADYFQSVAPWGYTTFYRFFAALGLDPMFVAKLVPIPLALIAAGYSFGLSMQLLPVPFTAFLSSLLLQQVIWTHDDVPSATPRAFLAPIFLFFLYYLLKRQLLPCIVAIVLQGLFYPQYVFVFAGITLLQPIHWHQGRPSLSQDRKEYWFCAVLLAAAVLVMLPYALANSEYGPTITAAEARTLPEFYRRGRSSFFTDDPLAFWLYGDRSGIFPDFRPATIAIGIFLPLLLRFPDRFPLVRQLTDRIKILQQLAVVGLSLFVVAHLVLFKLHLPSRYTAHTLRFALALATALTLTILLDAGLQWARRQVPPRIDRRILVWGLAVVFSLGILLFPHLLLDFPKTNYQKGAYANLYRFFEQQPTDIVIAGLLDATDDLPSLSERSILVGIEYAIPYHTGYANQFRQRVHDLIRAHYSLTRPEVVEFTNTYGIDYWLVSREAFQTEFLEEQWVKRYPAEIKAAESNLEKGNPFLRRSINRCAVFEDRAADLYVLDANCVIKKS